MNILGTAQQLAALIVQNERARFIITAFHDDALMTKGHWLRVQWADDLITLCSTRDVAQPRDFATIDAALNAAKKIAATAGREQDHKWTGEAHRLPPMPEITIEVL